MESLTLFVLVLDSTLRLSAPLVLAALAGLFSERSGIIDIGLEGKMLGAAFAAAAVAAVSGSPWAGLAAGVGTSVLLAMVHGYACITHRGDQVVSGLALNILVSGLTAVLGIAWFAQGGRTPQLPGEARFLAVPVAAWVLYRTRFGLRLRAVGENPESADTAGVPVVGQRYRALLCTGVACGVAGTYLSLAQSAGFINDMTAGKGYIALAALIFGKWRPVPAMLACLLFGFLDAVAIRLQGVDLPGIGEVPVQLVQALPYVLTVVLLAGFIGRAVPPRALGVPYVKER